MYDNILSLLFYGLIALSGYQLLFGHAEASLSASAPAYLFLLILRR